MKAIVCPRWGPPDVLELRDVEKPAPEDNEVLIRIHAATVSAGDCEMRGLKLPTWFLPLALGGFGFRGPRRKILGQELAGEVEAVGRDVELFETGDQVFGSTGFGFGAYAEYASLPESEILAAKPANMTYEEAATVPTGGLNALHFLRKGKVRGGQSVLINGAGGSIGTFATQIAKSFGAEVTCVDSTGKLDMLSSIGADHVIDYTQEDFSKGGETYDVIFDVVCKGSLSDGTGALKEGGTYLLGNPGPSRIVQGRWISMRSNKRVIGGTAEYGREHLDYLKELIEAGKIASVIDRRYPLEQTAEAHRYVETGQKKGNVVITVEHNDRT
jgi:NADPH:quinone reductase-like Zn-dependent oxidoreductase